MKKPGQIPVYYSDFPKKQSQKIFGKFTNVRGIRSVFPLVFALFFLMPVWPDDGAGEDQNGSSQEITSSDTPSSELDSSDTPFDMPTDTSDEASSDASSQADSDAAAVDSTVEQQRLDIMRFGTETEIANLIQILKNEKVSYLDKELIDIAQNTRNRNILSGIFSFFADMEKKGLEDRAIRAIQERDLEANDVVMAAVDYLGRVKAVNAKDSLEELINSGESRFLNNSFRALGRTANSQSADSIAFFLLDYYNNRNPGDDNRREIITALGETRSTEPVSFLSDLAKNNEERAVLRIAALDSLSKIGSVDGLDAIIEAASSPDPNVRSAAIAALGPFSGEAADNTILEGFRDSYYRTRIGAAQASGKRKLINAIPFLQFRAENDDVPSVRDEAIRALGAINTDATTAILDSLFSNQKNSDRVRILSAGMLLQNNADAYGSKVIVEMDDAKNKKQTALYNGFVRILMTAKSGIFEDFARRLIANGGIIEKSLALDLILNNGFRGLADDIRPLQDEKKYGASLARKAKATLEKLGLDS